MGNFKSLFTIRKKKKVKHPVVIVGANRNSFDYMNLTHSKYKINKKTGRKRKNFPLINNPDSNDREPSFLYKKINKDYKFKFSKAFKNYNLSDEDKKNLIKFLEGKKKK